MKVGRGEGCSAELQGICMHLLHKRWSEGGANTATATGIVTRKTATKVAATATAKAATAATTTTTTTTTTTVVLAVLYVEDDNAFQCFHAGTCQHFLFGGATASLKIWHMTFHDWGHLSTLPFWGRYSKPEKLTYDVPWLGALVNTSIWGGYSKPEKLTYDNPWFQAPQIQLPGEGGTVTAICDVTDQLEARTGGLLVEVGYCGWYLRVVYELSWWPSKKLWRCPRTRPATSSCMARCWRARAASGAARARAQLTSRLGRLGTC